MSLDKKQQDGKSVPSMLNKAGYSKLSFLKLFLSFDKQQQFIEIAGSIFDEKYLRCTYFKVCNILGVMTRLCFKEDAHKKIYDDKRINLCRLPTTI